MPFKLDDIDIAMLESLLKDGRKSFRQISREIDVKHSDRKNSIRKAGRCWSNKSSLAGFRLGKA